MIPAMMFLRVKILVGLGVDCDDVSVGVAEGGITVGAGLRLGLDLVLLILK